jgi:hypothetical protein
MGGTFSTSGDNINVDNRENIKNSLKTAIDTVPKDDDKKNLTTLLEEISKQPEDSNDSSTDKPHVTIEIFGSEDANSKGFHINDYKITPHNLDKTFSPNDQVEYFLTNVFDYIKNSNLPEDKRDKKLNNIFHKYTETVTFDSTKKEENEQPNQSGGKKKRSRNRKPKSRHRKTKKH